MVTIIFAQLGSTKRMAMPIPVTLPIHKVLECLNLEYGGEWAWVQELNYKEGILFEAEEVYKGFDNRETDDYCGNLTTIQDT